MRVYVAVVAGRALVAFNSDNNDAANEYVHSAPFRSDLMVLENEGQPLWNGKDEIFLRDPFPEERAAFNASLTQAIKDNELEDDEEEWTVFLIPVSDPTDLE